MFRAIGRYFTAFLYLITGRIDRARKTLETDPHVMAASYDDIIREKRARIQQYMGAVSTLMAQQEKKKEELKRLNEEATRLEKIMAGALAAAKKRAAELQASGKSLEDIKHDEAYLKHQGAFRDTSTTLEEKKSRIASLSTDIKGYDGQIANHTLQLQSLQREMEKLKTEAADSVARIISATEQKQLADMLSGLSTDNSSERLAGIRSAVAEAEAGAKISTKLAGTDAKAAEAEYLVYAETSVADDEFARLVGLSKQVDDRAAGTAVTAEPETKDTFTA
ncbi:MAG TPA: hypothetical protein VI873_01060 [Candidatus Peribacteraceae bacterium]|nr:hypothetical protein [Candidatus Peribacteraceae bacterium]